MQIAFFDDYNAAFAALSDKRADGFLADKMLLLWFAQRSGHAADFALIDEYDLPRTAGFAVRRTSPASSTWSTRRCCGSSLRRSREDLRCRFAPVPEPSAFSRISA